MQFQNRKELLEIQLKQVKNHKALIIHAKLLRQTNFQNISTKDKGVAYLDVG